MNIMTLMALSQMSGGQLAVPGGDWFASQNRKKKEKLRKHLLRGADFLTRGYLWWLGVPDVKLPDDSLDASASSADIMRAVKANIALVQKTTQKDYLASFILSGAEWTIEFITDFMMDSDDDVQMMTQILQQQQQQQVQAATAINAAAAAQNSGHAAAATGVNPAVIRPVMSGVGGGAPGGAPAWDPNYAGGHYRIPGFRANALFRVVDGDRVYLVTDGQPNR